MAAASKVISKPKHDEKTRELALLALATHSGRGGPAQKELAEAGVELDASTLYRWKKRYEAEYERVRARVLPALQEEAREDFRALGIKQRELADKIADRMLNEVDEIPAKELGKNLQATTISAATSMDKSELPHERPQGNDLSFNEVVRALSAKGVMKAQVSVEVDTSQEPKPVENLEK